MEYVLCDTPFCSESSGFRLWLKSAEDGLQHDFSWMADKASTVL